MTTIIWWIRRDLRLHDNTALYAASREADRVIPVYILDPALLNSERCAGPRIGWLNNSLRVFDRDLRAINARLIVREGRPEAVLPDLAQATGANAVYFNRDYSPYAAARDGRVRAALHDRGVTVRDFPDLVIHEADEVRTGSDKPFSVYTPYRRAWEALPKPDTLPKPNRLNMPSQLTSAPIPATARFPALHPEIEIQPTFEPGEAAALARLNHFMDADVYRYAETRNLPALDGTSALSPYLRWGMLSPRTCYHAALAARERATSAAARASIETWIGELVWREFYYQVLARNPHVVHSAYRSVYDAIQWDNDPALIESWKTGHTGYPIVDAAMRQLNISGWMHNRCRMIVASFLCKDLLVDWRIGERYFMQRLLDADLANNNGGWQWTAGTGTDASPYFRIFNPTAQGKKFDPDGTYIRRWLPELRGVPDSHIHEPGKLPRADQERVGCIIGKDYPAPVVDHSAQRDRVLRTYARARESEAEK